MLDIRVTTDEEFKLNTYSNYQEWGNNLTIEQYWERELVSKQYVKGHRGWILFDSENPNEVLASCESYTQESFYCLKNQPNEIKKGLSESIASVFVDPKYRGKGYGKKLMTLVYQKFQEQENKIFCDLYSDIDPILYEKCGWKLYPSTTLKIKLSTTQEEDDDSLSKNKEILEKINNISNNVFDSEPITDENIEIVLKKGHQQTIDTLIQLSNDEATKNNDEIQYYFTKQFTTGEFYWEISQAKVYSTYLSGTKMPSVFGHVIYNGDSVDRSSIDSIKSFIVWTFDYREKTLKILKLSADSESDFKFLIKKAYDQCLESNFNTIYSWYPKSSDNKFKESFIESIGCKVEIRDGSRPMVSSWINFNNENDQQQTTKDKNNFDKGVWINVEKFGWC